jgi:hypothetical protein
MGRCPHCETTVEADFEFVGQTKSGRSGGQYANFQVVCPNCEAILGGAIMSKVESSSGFL